MKTFQIYKHPISDIEAIKVGFSFPAFFFGWIWMFLKKLWVLGCIYLFLQFLIITLNEMKIDLDPGAIRLSFLHYNTMKEIKHLIAGLKVALG